MSTRNHVLALIFLMAVLAFTVFAAKRLLFRISPAASGVALPPHAANPATKPSVPKPSAAVPAPSSTSPASTKVAPASPAAVAPTPAVPASPAPAPPAPARSATAPAAPARATPPPASPAHSVPAPSARARATPAPAPKTRENASTPAAKGAVPAPPKAQPPAAKHPAVVAKDRHSEDRHLEDRHSESHHSENQHAEADRAQLRFGSGVRLWIRVIAINRKPDGSFTFRGALLQPVTLANRNQLDPGTGVAGSGTADNGHLQVQVSGFTIAGANYELLDASGSNGRSGTGLAVELDPGKLLEVWLAPSSMYRKTP